MKIVIDTNVVVSGVFFGGYPQKVLMLIVEEKISAAATPRIIDEYIEIIEQMIMRKQGNLGKDILRLFLEKVEIVKENSNVALCRDPEDDKFINCAIDSSAFYIVSGDKDLLVLQDIGEIQILTAKDFCILLGL